MEGSPESHGLQYSVRSISLPARLQPQSIKIEAEINRLKSSRETSPVSAGLVGLVEMYNCVDEFIHSPLAQQALCKRQHSMVMEEALERSLGLLDSCGAAWDMVVMMKDHVQDLHSALRRKGGDSSIESNVNAYMSFRKKMKKVVTKCIGSLNQMESKMGSSSSSSSPLLDVDHSLLMVVRVLREVTAITICVFRSLLLFLSVSTSNTKAGGWSLISKLTITRSTASERSNQKILNEVGRVDFELQSLHGFIQSNDIGNANIQMVRSSLRTLETSITSLEAGLDSTFRCLVQNRVSLLNILAN